jgi:hypothetical protein
LELLCFLKLCQLLLQVAGGRRTSLDSIQIAPELCFCGFAGLLLFLSGCLEVIELLLKIGSLVLSGLQLVLSVA